jgi:hypothetical protein
MSKLSMSHGQESEHAVIPLAFLHHQDIHTSEKG